MMKQPNKESKPESGFIAKDVTLEKDRKKIAAVMSITGSGISKVEKSEKPPVSAAVDSPELSEPKTEELKAAAEGPNEPDPITKLTDPKKFKNHRRVLVLKHPIQDIFNYSTLKTFMDAAKWKKGQPLKVKRLLLDVYGGEGLKRCIQAQLGYKVIRGGRSHYLKLPEGIEDAINEVMKTNPEIPISIKDMKEDEHRTMDANSKVELHIPDLGHISRFEEPPDFQMNTSGTGDNIEVLRENVKSASKD